MGYAVAEAARRRGHEVVLVSGPVSLAAPDGVLTERVISADAMLAAVRLHFATCDALIMAAAVADWRPATRSVQKLKKLKTAGELQLEPTPDILSTLRPLKGGRLVVGFAAETENLLSEAKRKCESKGLDLIVANDVGRSDAGFDVDTNQVVFVHPDGVTEALPLMSKVAVADRIIEWVEIKRGLVAGGKTRPVPLREIEPGLEAGGARMARIMGFIREVDKLKSVFRKTLLMNGSRYENDAEHSWHLALMAMLLGEYANAKVLNLARVIEMVLVHDLVEIDAGDTYCYDDAGNASKVERERKAADRVFGLLPEDHGRRLRALWEEFEERRTPESRFAAALDRVQPLMHNYFTNGVVWRNHGIISDKVRERNHHVTDGSTVLWEYADRLIRQAVEDGFLDSK
jgi:putative hydrolase of HD superfamily